MLTFFVMNSTYTSASGVTMVELLTVLSITAILLGLGLPQFRELHERWQVLQTSRNLESTLTLARSLAIQRGGNIGMRKNNTTAQGCQNASTNQEWGCGWFIYADTNSNGSWNVNEPKLHEVTLNGSVNVMHTSGGNNIRFDRFGMASGLNAKGFTLTPATTGISSPAIQTLCMSSGGRIRLINDSRCPKK